MPESFWVEQGSDGFGNRVVSGGTNILHTSFDYICKGTVELTTYCIPDANPHPMYGKGRNTLQSKSLNEILDIMHAVHFSMEYVPGVTDVNTPVTEIMKTRQGVCQDYSHMMIEICRNRGYHARYVCGLMSGEGATHAWVEVHDGHCWYAFDPTNDTAIANGYIKLAHGRNALDCPVSRGTYIGIAQQQTVVQVKVFSQQ